MLASEQGAGGGGGGGVHVHLMHPAGSAPEQVCWF